MPTQLEIKLRHCLVVVLDSSFSPHEGLANDERQLVFSTVQTLETTGDPVFKNLSILVAVAMLKLLFLAQ